ncbi:hypothetical protein ASD54_11010 [Rhizobium sp. Root149]|uniref:DUF3168 domain-containing protein n=1 Tax=Rhizobium sp. Root149 TaxID=1736473 RepID=UPI000715F99A|nr:DUF3168 domain-containing protein [Rhizobium sp. Root149]KQZ50730.1 hypothetical protein ASD54_11010 [Rhizobium sp. Root149]
MTPELSLQKAIRDRLVGSAEITSHVPAANILDRNERPNPTPSIILGECHSVDEGDSIARRLTRIYCDIHVWKREPSTVGVKIIAGHARIALHQRLVLDAGFHCADSRLASVRIMRDPDGETSHAILTLSALVEDLI